jgi:sulfate adenylyltransferase
MITSVAPAATSAILSPASATTVSTALIKQPLPYGGRLINLLVNADEIDALTARAASLPVLRLSTRAECDLELLATGAFSPLTGFMGEKDYRRVLHEMRLADGTLFPIPITLPVQPGQGIEPGAEVALRNGHNDLLALLTIEEIFPRSWEEEARYVLGTLDERHPVVAEMRHWPPFNVSGRLRVLRLPPRHDFAPLRLTPAETRARLAQMGASNVVAFQTRNPLHRGHEELTRRAAADVGGVLLLHPVVGMTKPGDVEHYTRVRTYQALAERYFEPGQVLLALLPLAMRMAGPREALWHAIIRRNFGATHFIVGRDHAGPGKDSSGRPFYGPFEAQETAARHADELGIEILTFGEMVYLPDTRNYEERERLQPDAHFVELSGTLLRDEYLDRGRLLPQWIMRPEPARILLESRPPRHRQGVCIWFTGLSGAGKSTTAEVLTELLLEHGRQVTLLDGDVVRTHLSRGLGFSREDRDVNILRIGFVAAEVVRHGGVAICAAVSPYRAARTQVRNLVGHDRFIEVFVDTPLEVCEARDVKGMYRQARAGLITGFTGIDDPYEPPLAPELSLETMQRSPIENAHLLLALLVERGFVRAPGDWQSEWARDEL